MLLYDNMLSINLLFQLSGCYVDEEANTEAETFRDLMVFTKDYEVDG